MKKLSVIISLFVFIFIFQIVCSGKPSIQFEKMSHDFGEAHHNTNLKHVFTFRNTGRSTLKITKIKAG